MPRLLPLYVDGSRGRSGRYAAEFEEGGITTIGWGEVGDLKETQTREGIAAL
jgi:hypothetical protein